MSVLGFWKWDGIDRWSSESDASQEDTIKDGIDTWSKRIGIDSRIGIGIGIRIVGWSRHCRRIGVDSW